jgi:hypothetical protein
VNATCTPAGTALIVDGRGHATRRSKHIALDAALDRVLDGRGRILGRHLVRQKAVMSRPFGLHLIVTC